MQAVSTLAPRRSQVIRQHKERGGRVAAVLPIHYPRALLRAFDLLPVEVWGPPQIDPSHGAAHLQPHVCSIVRNALSFLLAGGLEAADVIVVPHTCDSLQGLGSILIDFVRPRQPVLPLYLPRGNHADALRFLADEFQSLYRALVQITDRAPSHADLMASIQREEKADQLLVDLHRRRRNLSLTQIEFYRLVRAREFLPAEVFSDLVEATLAVAQSGQPQGPPPQTAPAPRDAGIPILLSGIVPEPMSLFDALEKMNALVVADDLACCGRRLYPPGASDNPLTRMAEGILAAPPDSTRGSSIQERLDHLLRLAKTSGARGIVFYDVKFCEPELFYLPSLRQGLQRAGVESVTVEVDLNDPLSHQVLTRLEAFLEMIA